MNNNGINSKILKMISSANVQKLKNQAEVIKMMNKSTSQSMRKNKKKLKAAGKDVMESYNIVSTTVYHDNIEMGIKENYEFKEYIEIVSKNISESSDWAVIANTLYEQKSIEVFVEEKMQNLIKNELNGLEILEHSYIIEDDQVIFDFIVEQDGKTQEHIFYSSINKD